MDTLTGSRYKMVPGVAAMIAFFLCSGCGNNGASPASETHTTSKQHAFAQRITGVKDVDNLAKISDNLYRGAQPDDDGYKYLRSLGIKTVINLRQHHSERKDVESQGMRYVEIPLQANVFGSEPPTTEQVKQFSGIVLDPANQPVYFHCAQGKDRTGTMAALYRMEVDKWTADEAIEEMRHFGYHDIYKDLMDYVKSYKPQGLSEQ